MNVGGRIERIRWAEAGGYAIGLAGLVAAVTFDAARSIFYIATAVMALGLAPVMLGFYELGGRTPRALALGALSIGGLAVFVFAAVFLGAGAGIVAIDNNLAAEGPLAIFSAAAVVIGLWLIGAPILAGSWLTLTPRWLGVICGLAWLVESIGLLTQGTQSSVTTIGGIGVQVLFPIWGVVIGRLFAAIRLPMTSGDR